MIISHKHKFLTIDVPKTGTKTLKISLEKHVKLDVIARGKLQHISISDCKNIFFSGEYNIDDYFKFTIVRNPWDRYTSFCCYVFDKAYEYEQAIKSGSASEFSEIRTNQGEAFINLLKNFKNNKKEVLKHLIKTRHPQCFYVESRDNSTNIDMFATTENLNKDIITFFNKIGIKDIPEVVYGNKGSNTNLYDECYDQELIDMVAEKEKWVIDKFDYDYN